MTLLPLPPEEDLAALSRLPVSHEAQRMLMRYAALLVEWNEKFNLVAASTLPHLWRRHMLDSAQLFPLLPKGTRRLVDLGSGAGFPALVLSIMGVPEVHVIESIGKKANFLSAVVKDLGLNAIVHHARIESVRELEADVVTARAVTSLPILLSLAKPFMGRNSCALLLKGEKADAELTEAAKYWTFTCDKTPSLSDPSGLVLKINELKVLRKDDPRRHRHHS
ncbi:MAG: 16S rRNA (guanine(527)-N(7))-methyltransferase RsmG [Alphaproteobacteria bacterium]|nr:16S rRNA (guanine(527)-N(7))-methyltransferase RsmG [Alphaproteobacteria bacterium]